MRRPIAGPGPGQTRAGTGRFARAIVAGLVLAPALGGCLSTPLSTLDTAGPAAAAVAQLWWVMLAGASLIFAVVATLLAYAFWRADRTIEVSGRRWIVGGGLVFPTVTLSALLAYSLLVGERVLARVDPNALVVEAVASQFAWTFRYPDRPDLPPSDVLAIPVGRTVEMRVTSTDVIHSFWVPALAGKIDAIPGHVNVIRLRADRPGIYRGQCAEFCGAGHAAMGFLVEARAGDTPASGRATP